MLENTRNSGVVYFMIFPSFWEKGLVNMVQELKREDVSDLSRPDSYDDVARML